MSQLQWIARLLFGPSHHQQCAVTFCNKVVVLPRESRCCIRVPHLDSRLSLAAIEHYMARVLDVTKPLFFKVNYDLIHQFFFDPDKKNAFAHNWVRNFQLLKLWQCDACKCFPPLWDHFPNSLGHRVKAVISPPRINQNRLHISNLLHSWLAVIEILVCKLEIKFFDSPDFHHFRQVLQLINPIQIILLGFSVFDWLLLLICLLLDPWHNNFENITVFLRNFPGLQSVIPPQALWVLGFPKKFEFLRRPLFRDRF